MTHLAAKVEVGSDTFEKGWVAASIAIFIDGTNKREKSSDEDKQSEHHENYGNTLFKSFDRLLEVPGPEKFAT